MCVSNYLIVIHSTFHICLRIPQVECWVSDQKMLAEIDPKKSIDNQNSYWDILRNYMEKYQEI